MERRMETYFSVNGEGFLVEGIGQATISAAIMHGQKINPKQPVKLEGFCVDGKDLPVNLKMSHRHFYFHKKNSRSFASSKGVM